MECIYQEIECPRSEDLEKKGQLNCAGCSAMRPIYCCPTSRLAIGEDDYNLEDS